MDNNVSRVSYDITADGRVIRVKSVNIWPVTIFLCVWLAGWSFGGFEAIKAVYGMLVKFETGSLPALIFLLVWLCGWIFGEVFALAIVLWSFLGTEIMTVSQGELIVDYDIKVFKYRTRYNVLEIDDITREKNGASFEFRKKKKMIGLMLSGADLDIFMTYLKQCLPQGRFV
jgi:hypothetical protein